MNNAETGQHLERTLMDVWDSAVREQPGEPAVRDAGDQWSYHRLDALTGAGTAALTARGVRAEDRVTISMRRGARGVPTETEWAGDLPGALPLPDEGSAELTVAFSALRDGGLDLALASDPVRLRSNVILGFTSLPVTVTG